MDKNINHDFLNLIKKIEQEKSVMEAIEWLYEGIECLLENKKYSTIEEYLEHFLISDFSFDLHVAFLTITNRDKDKISNRKKLYQSSIKLGCQLMSKQKTLSTLKGLE